MWIFFASTEDECNLEHGTALKCDLAWGCNVLISHPHEEIFTVNDDVPGALKHAKYYPDVSAAHSSLIDELLCDPLGCVFGANVSGYRWGIVDQSRYRHTQCLQSQSNARGIVTKHKHMLELIKFAANAHGCVGKLVATIKDSVNTSIFINGSMRVSTTHDQTNFVVISPSFESSFAFENYPSHQITSKIDYPLNGNSFETIESSPDPRTPSRTNLSYANLHKTNVKVSFESSHKLEWKEHSRTKPRVVTPSSNPFMMRPSQRQC